MTLVNLSFMRIVRMATGFLCLSCVSAGVPACCEPQPYDKVVTKDAKTTNGIFIVHHVADDYYYEIPKINSTKSSSGMHASRKPRGASVSAACWWRIMWSAGN